MKKFYLFSLLLTLCCAGLVTSCNDDDPAEGVPDVTLRVDPQSVDAAAEGGAYAVVYAVENPVEGAQLAFEGAADWISDLKADADKITFVVAPNTSGEVRHTNIAVHYGKIRNAAQFAVMQAAANSAEQMFEMKVSNPTESSLTITILPKDKEMVYITRTIAKDDYLSYGSDEAVIASDIQELVDFAAEIEITPQELLPDFTDKGDIVDQVMGGLPWGERFVTYVYGIDPETLKAVTAVEKVEGETIAVPLNDVEFTISAIADSNFVDINIMPGKYEGYYFVNIVEIDEAMTDAEIDKTVKAEWAQMRYIYHEQFELGYDEIPAELCWQGVFANRVEMNANENYVVYAFTIDDRALLNSKVAFTRVRTGEVAPSDNILNIQVSDVRAYSAFVTINPTNDDGYAVAAWGADELADMTQEELIEVLCMEAGGTVNGVIEAPLEGLLPDTEYRIFAFGFQGGVMTTNLYEASFRTPKAILSSLEAELSYGPYYDAYAVAALDEEYFNHAIQATVFAPIDFVKYQGKAFYSAFLPATVAEEYTDDMIKSMVIASYYPTNTEVPYAILSVIYGDSKVGVAFTEDEAGNYSKLYRGPVLCPNELGVGDPQELVDNYPWPTNATRAAVTVPRMKEQSKVVLHHGANPRCSKLVKQHAAFRANLDQAQLNARERKLLAKQMF